MRFDKEKAITLRKQGKSYKEICSSLGMSKSTLSKWFKGEDYSENIRIAVTERARSESRERIKKLNKVRGTALEATYEVAKEEAKRELEHLHNNPLFLTAVALYWGEGDKATKNHIRIINTEPEILQIFLKFLVDICDSDKNRISLALFIYEDLNEQKCKKFWSKKVGIHKFHKTQVLPSRHKTKKLPYGTASLVLTDTYLKKKINVWIDQLPEMVLNRAPKK